MITVSLLGRDEYEAIRYTDKLHKAIKDIYQCKDEEINFFAPRSFLIHDGREQTTFRLDVKVEAPKGTEDKETEASNAIAALLKDDAAIHIRIVFDYYDPKHEHRYIDNDYPLYRDKSNTVQAQEAHDEEAENQEYEETYEEPYRGDIIGDFDKFLKQHPDATNEEVYEALTGIRKDVTERHHKEK